MTGKHTYTVAVTKAVMHCRELTLLKAHIHFRMRVHYMDNLAVMSLAIKM